MNSIARTSALLDSSRDLTVEAAGSARTVNARPSSRELSFTQVKRLLDSRNDREILDGLKRVIAMIYRSKPCLPYFSAVVKNVASPNVEIKKLVYIYLLHHAESEPDLALLSINTIQKSLSDPSPQIRALALKVMSGIRVPVISQIVSLAIKKGIVDMSPLVRKAAALAIPKCYRLDPNTLPQLLEYSSTLLGDKQYFVVGPAVMAFLEVCPERVDLLHKHYRSLVRKLADMDEWSQLATLKLLTNYARKSFPRRYRSRKPEVENDFYEKPAPMDREIDTEQGILVIDQDLELFLKACKSLLFSRNAAIIVSVVRCLLTLGAPADIDVAVGPLVALLRASKDIQTVVMYNIIAVCLVRPRLFVPYATHFLVRSLESIILTRLKFEVQTLIFPFLQTPMQDIFIVELEHFAHSTDAELIQESVQAIGRCAQHESPASEKCMRLLLESVSSQDGPLVASSTTTVRHLIQRNPSAHVNMVIRLAKNLDTLTNPEARAAVIWLVGEFAGLPDDQNIAPDVLRILVRNFVEEAVTTKLQILLLAAKVYLHFLLKTASKREPSAKLGEAEQQLESGQESAELSVGEAGEEGWDEKPPDSTEYGEDNHPIPKLWEHVLLLTRYDTSYDLRDRARVLKALLSDPSSTELASLMLLAPKPVPHAPSPSEYRRGILLGSTGLVLGTKNLLGYEELPDWVQEGQEPDAKSRDEPIGGGSGARSGHPSPGMVPAAAELDRAVKQKGLEKMMAAGKGKTLDDWLNEKSASEGEEGDEESETDEEDVEVEEEEGSEDEYEEVTASESEEEEEQMRQPLVH